MRLPGASSEVGDILAQVLRETRQAPVLAVVIIGDRFQGDLKAVTAKARQLAAAGRAGSYSSRAPPPRRSVRSARSPKPPTVPISDSTRMSSASRNACRA
jgi:hypothetical protein